MGYILISFSLRTLVVPLSFPLPGNENYFCPYHGFCCLSHYLSHTFTVFNPSSPKYLYKTFPTFLLLVSYWSLILSGLPPYIVFLMENYPNIDGLVLDLVNRTESYNCNEYKLELPSLHNESDKMKLSLIGKILSNRSFSAMVVKEIVDKAWQLNFLVSMKKMDRNILLFSFEHEANLNSVAVDTSWCSSCP